MNPYEVIRKKTEEWHKEYLINLPSHIIPEPLIYPKEGRPECCVKYCRWKVNSEYQIEDGRKTKLLWASDMCPKHDKKREESKE